MKNSDECKKECETKKSFWAHAKFEICVVVIAILAVACIGLVVKGNHCAKVTVADSTAVVADSIAPAPTDTVAKCIPKDSVK